MNKLPQNHDDITALELMGRITPETAALLRAKSAPPMMSSEQPRFAPPPAFLAQKTQPVSMVPSIGENMPVPEPAALSPNGPVAPESIQAPLGVRSTKGKGGQLEEAAREVDEAKRLSLEADTRLRDAELREADLNAPIIARQEEEARAAAQTYASIQKRTDELVEEQLELNRKEIDTIKNATVDPLRLLKGGNGILAAISVALGSLGSALAKTPNYAMEIIDNAIDRDVAAQQAELSKRKDVLGMRNDLVGRMIAQSGNKQAGLLGYKALLQDLSAAEIAKNAAMVRDEKIKAQWGKLASAQMEKAAATRAEFAGVASNIAHQRATEEYNRAQIGLGHYQAKTQRMAVGANALNESEKAKDARDESIRKRTVEGLEGLATDERNVPKIRERKGQLDAAALAIQEAIEMLNRPDAEKNFRAQSAGKVMREQAIRVLGTIISNSGVINTGERPAYTEVVKNPALHDYTKDTLGAYEALLNAVTTIGNAEMKAEGFKGYAPPTFRPSEGSRVPSIRTDFTEVPEERLQSKVRPSWQTYNPDLLGYGASR